MTIESLLTHGRPVRSGEAASEIAEKLRISKSLAGRAVHQWGTPLIRRSRRCVVYPPTVVGEVIKRILAGDWPEPPRRKEKPDSLKSTSSKNE